MTTKHFTANVISASKVVPDGAFQNSAASGVWDLSEQYDLRRGGNWPETGNENPLAGDIALVAGGQLSVDPYATSVIQYFKITSTGNSTDYGNLDAAQSGVEGISSSTRAVFASVSGNPYKYQYIEIQTGGDTATFGEATQSATARMACCNSTRGLVAGGYLGGAAKNIIEYITIANTGNGTDFGDLSAGRYNGAGLQSTTRGVFGGGSTGSFSNIIDYVTIGSTGNASDFGDLVATGQSLAGASNSTRGIFGGGFNGSRSNVIQYITIANTGNTSDFGDLLAGNYELCGTSNSTRAVFMGGNTSGSGTNVIQYVTIGSTGNASDFGDLTNSIVHGGATSSAHGGIS